jgi:SAM-dependent methyltransferase
VDAVFEHPRLVGVYDALDPDRTDLVLHDRLLASLGARSVLDVGCGTGTFALMLADRGVEVTAVDPAAGSLAVARAKPGAQRVRWLLGDATGLPPLQVDAATMTANVAQAIVEPSAWDDTLRGVRAALRPGGCLVVETRDPAARAWASWTRASTHRVVELEGVGAVETWHDLTDVSGPLVSFTTTWVFHADATVLTSSSTLRFRERDEVVHALHAHGYVLDDVRSGPDRFGAELVFVARRDDAVPPAPDRSGQR